jgi:hypothetical protein
MGGSAAMLRLRARLPKTCLARVPELARSGPYGLGLTAEGTIIVVVALQALAASSVGRLTDCCRDAAPVVSASRRSGVWRLYATALREP